MSILNHGSQYLPSDQQSHMYIEYHEGFKKVCERIRAKYPDLTLQACARGRANYGVMPYFDEFWVSDNTDALQRIYMQWGTSYFFPAIAMASHISAAPNHQTFRVIPLKYRIDVAMSGRLGMEIQPKNMTEEEKTLCRKAIDDPSRRAIRRYLPSGFSVRSFGSSFLDVHFTGERQSRILLVEDRAFCQPTFTPCKDERIIPRQEIQSLRTEPDRQRASGLRG